MYAPRILEFAPEGAGAYRADLARHSLAENTSPLRAASGGHFNITKRA